MIKAYLAWISTGFEGEDFEIRYRIFKDEELIEKQSLTIGYRKPAILGQFSIMTILRRLELYKDEEITIIINDGFLRDSLRGTSGTKNQEVKEMAKENRKTMKQFINLTVKDISGNHLEIKEWDEILKP